ncbi:MAG: low molecular weight phosphotyrosine protein phosphatase [Xanthomonadaceae bacterium]|nr:low molecular weight phosphotyrosine protein phosphatase [Xanthomonadaceae bacterium]
MVRVLFVCMGNICRSPSAEGVFAALVEREGLRDQILIDSAGTHAYHVGEPPDPRAQSAALQRGIDLSGQRARKVCSEDFERFEYVLPMDLANYQILEGMRPAQGCAELRRFLEYAPDLPEEDVPDPYYGGPKGFARVLDLIEEAAEGLLREIRQRHGL